MAGRTSSHPDVVRTVCVTPSSGLALPTPVADHYQSEYSSAWNSQTSRPQETNQLRPLSGTEPYTSFPMKLYPRSAWKSLALRMTPEIFVRPDTGFLEYEPDGRVFFCMMHNNKPFPFRLREVRMFNATERLLRIEPPSEVIQLVERWRNTTTVDPRSLNLTPHDYTSQAWGHDTSGTVPTNLDIGMGNLSLPGYSNAPQHPPPGLYFWSQSQ